MRRIISGLVEQNEPSLDDPFEANKDEFGTTEFISDVFYILPDGTMLDGSGANQGGTAGSGRAFDHRNISYGGGRTKGMQEFMALGAIRAMPESAALDFVKEPTLEQYTRILQWVKHFNGEVIIEMEKGLGEYDDRDEYYKRNPDRSYREFDKGDSPRKVLGFIKRFWKQPVNEVLGTFWGWVLPDGKLLEGRETQNLIREFHGELVYNYWGDTGNYPEAGGGLDFAYLWAYDQGWIRYTGNNISAVPERVTKEAWNSLIKNHVMVHGRKKEWWHIDPIVLEYDGDVPTSDATAESVQLQWEDLINSRNMLEAMKAAGRRRLGSLLGLESLQEQLLVTPDQLWHSSGTKTQVIAMIPIDLFHKITTENSSQVQGKYDSARDLEDYNNWSREGEILNIPFMRIDINPDGTAKVGGHEGRTRAAAMKKAGYDKMPIGIQIRWGWDWKDPKKRENAVLKMTYDRDLKFEDIPDHIEMQFRDGQFFSKDIFDVILNGDDQINRSNASKVMAAQGAK